tara:strand:- start:17 stop:907 length:891 start_codon:yes stop_codon:yes gene_type:complete
MKSHAYISIGIPFYNTEKYLEDAICSVLAQTYQYWELILIDDGSSDKSLEIARDFESRDTRIRVISDGLNKKLPYRLNQIVREAKYDYIARMDADDLMSNHRLEKQIQVLESNKEIDFVTTGCFTIGKNNELTGVRLGDNYQMNAKMILEGVTNLLHASLLARKSWYIRNNYDESRILAEDFDLWLQAAKNNDLNYLVVEQPLYWYRVVENVTVKKMIQGYDMQMEIINSNYKGIVSVSRKNKIIRRFRLKKLVVKYLGFFNLMSVLLKSRCDDCRDQDISDYDESYTEIKRIGLF